jgi:TRAP-type C4-dicarboxylate transport system permease large subunit
MSNGFYNALIGYLLLHREQTGLLSLLFFTGAMALHFVVNDYGLRENHKHQYDRIGRWILAAAIIIGWVIGSATEIHQAAIAVLFAFLAGGVVLNVLKEELPEERESRFWAFALGATVYTALLLTL